MPVIDYKCNNCGSGMVFDSQSGMLTCKSCGQQYDIQRIEDPIQRNRAFERETVEYQCTSCGAVLMTEPTTSATVCSFCGSAVVLADRLSGRKAPAFVLPFAISKEQAIKAFRKWCKNGRLTPSGFMSANRIKNMTGMYVPFWLYDLNNHVEARGHGTRVRVYRQGDYEYTETQHYELYRKMRLNYVGVPIDAAEKMNDELMDRLEPFPYQALQPFKTPYLAGYLAEKYSYDEHQLLPRAKHKVAPYIDSALRGTTGSYTSVNFASKDIHTEMRKAHYALLPVWVVHYDYNKLEHTFAMNGQTGKVVGKPPISKGKVMAWFLGIFGISLVALKMIAFMMGGGF